MFHTTIELLHVTILPVDHRITEEVHFIVLDSHHHITELSPIIVFDFHHKIVDLFQSIIFHSHPKITSYSHFILFDSHHKILDHVQLILLPVVKIKLLVRILTNPFVWSIVALVLSHVETKITFSICWTTLLKSVDKSLSAAYTTINHKLAAAKTVHKVNTAVFEIFIIFVLGYKIYISLFNYIQKKNPVKFSPTFFYYI